MRIISDSDVVERRDSTGDALVLREAPYQSSVVAVSKLEQQEAKEEFKHLKDIGVVDKDSSIFDLAKQAEKDDPEAVKNAQKNLAEKADSAAVARLKLEALAVKLIIGGQNYGGNAILEQYDKMDPASVAWVAEQVRDVWKSAMPSDEEKNGAGADAAVLAGAPVSSAKESSNATPGDSATD